jgi:hypothetical protein
MQLPKSLTESKRGRTFNFRTRGQGIGARLLLWVISPAPVVRILSTERQVAIFEVPVIYHDMEMPSY